MGHRITATRGDTLELSATVENVVNPQNGKCFFTLKRNVNDADTMAIFRKTSAAGEGVTFEASTASTPATFRVKLGHAEQRAEILDGDLDVELRFDFRYRTPNGDHYTLRKGSIVFTHEVTHDPTI